MKVLVTGAAGFIGKNLLLHLSERSDIDVVSFTREDDVTELPTLLNGVEFIFHLAGVNRPKDIEEFNDGNTQLTQLLVDAVLETACKAPILYTSSIQADVDNPYGRSKLAAEEALLSLKKRQGISLGVFRLPNVFGKWARPNYNSVVATFCHNIVNDLPIQINDPDATINLVYVDDVVEQFIECMDGKREILKQNEISPVYRITVGELADQLYRFRGSRESMVTEPVGKGLVRALYSTYLSYLPKESFTYEVPKHGDNRGVFVEMLKTPDSGQFSFFTAHPGITRGGHYHHTKTEKFLVINGSALFKFKHMHTGEYHELITSGDNPVIVETVPGWTHDITNVGDEEMVVMLWANEIFDRSNPDTYACALSDVN